MVYLREKHFEMSMVQFRHILITFHAMFIGWSNQTTLFSYISLFIVYLSSKVKESLGTYKLGRI